MLNELVETTKLKPTRKFNNIPWLHNESLQYILIHCGSRMKAVLDGYLKHKCTAVRNKAVLGARSKACEKKYVIRYQEQNYARSWMPGTKAV